MNSFIVFEGVDGSGKTTIGEKLAQEIGGIYMRTPSEGLRPARSYIDSSPSSEAKLLFYLSSVVDASQRIALTRETQPVICDRYIWSTLIPHSVYHNVDLNSLEHSLRFITEKLEVPTHTFLLTVSEDEQLKRLGLRSEGNRTASDTFCLNRTLRRRAHESYKSIAKREGWTIIDTDHKNIESVMNEVLQLTSEGVLI